MATNLAGRIEYANFSPNATADDIRNLCDVAAQAGYAAVLVHPYWLRLARSRLGKESGVQVGTILSYPLGAEVASVKGLAARLAVGDGAQLLGFVINLAVLLADPPACGQEISYVVKQARLAADDEVEITVVVESSLLTPPQQQEIAAFAQQARADFIQPGSGFGDRHTTAADLANFRTAGLKLKAAARRDAADLLQAGAERLVVQAGAA